MKRIAKLLKISILAAIITIGSIGIAQAGPEVPGSVAVGITASQTARISVTQVLPPDPIVPPDPAHVRLSFLDA